MMAAVFTDKVIALFFNFRTREAMKGDDDVSHLYRLREMSIIKFYCFILDKSRRKNKNKILQEIHKNEHQTRRLPSKDIYLFILTIIVLKNKNKILHVPTSGFDIPLQMLFLLLLHTYVCFPKIRNFTCRPCCFAHIISFQCRSLSI